MTSTFWMTNYLRASLPALASIGFISGFSINVTMANLSSHLIVFAMIVLTMFGKIAFNSLSQKENFLWFLDESEIKKNRFLIAYARIIGIGVAPGATLMSIAQHSSSTGVMAFALLTLSAILITEGKKFDRKIKEAN